MERTSVSSPFGFADSEITDYLKKDDELIVGVKAWNEKRLAVRFGGFVALCDRGAWSVSDLCESCSSTQLLKEALDQLYEVVPRDHGLRVFEFLNMDDDTVLEIIANNIIVSRID